MDRDKIVTEVINKYIKENCERVDEFRNPNIAHEVGVYANNLKRIKDDIIRGGVSKNEITMVKLDNIIVALNNLEKMMSM